MILKYPGGKSRLAETIAKQIGACERLFEPMCGGGAVFLQHTAGGMVGDINPYVVSVLQFAAIGPEDLVGACRYVWDRYGADRDGYYRARSMFNSVVAGCDCPLNVNDTALFIYLNRHGFNGLVRFNRNGLFNVPFGRYEHVPVPEAQIWQAHHWLRGRQVEWRIGDYRATTFDVRKGDAVYVDPPYLSENGDGVTGFSAYAAVQFGAEEHVELDDWATELARTGVRIFVSASATRETLHIYRGLSDLIELEGRRSISRDGDTRGVKKEYLIVYV